MFSIQTSFAAASFAQRSDYLDAREKLRTGQSDEFRKLSRKLENYALHPYLVYYDLNQRLNTVSSSELMGFVEKHPEIPATSLLHKRWLRKLGERRQWRTLRAHYTHDTNATLRCYYLRSLYGTGEQTLALDQTTDIWLQPVSQPKACDPLFEVWRQTDRFTETVVWQRFEAAILANERSLANYLIRYFSGSNKNAAQAYYDVHVSPSKIARTSQFRADTATYRTLIAHGISRLAKRDPKKASAAWRSYAKSHDFDTTTIERIEGLLAAEMAAQEQSFPRPNKRAYITAPDLIEDLADTAVEQQNWREAAHWITQLPSDMQQKSQWQYWLGRAQQSLQADPQVAAPRFQSLAQQRHYYGFLAARSLGLPGQMNATSGQPSLTEVSRIQRNPGLERAVELFAVGDDINARREWFAALKSMNYEQQLLAAELAAQLGLTAMAIRTANIAEARDHLHLRFPTVYEPQFRRASMRTSVPVPLLMAIARQESAMEASARSSADARGLMQLLPSTARIVARRARLPVPQSNDLYDPGTNIALGSYHLAWLIERYNNQTPLAIAAYNAGEHRVDRWIKDAQGLPMDVWIETIPFRETRNYVKNVLAFRHVYGASLKTPTPVLTIDEQVVRAR
jgi:peptidoglycan lytic transglycosylase